MTELVHRSRQFQYHTKSQLHPKPAHRPVADLARRDAPPLAQFKGPHGLRVVWSHLRSVFAMAAALNTKPNLRYDFTRYRPPVRRARIPRSPELSAKAGGGKGRGRNAAWPRRKSMMPSRHLGGESEEHLPAPRRAHRAAETLRRRNSNAAFLTRVKWQP